MKKLSSLTAAIALGVLAVSSGTLRAANTNALLMEIQLTGLVQKMTIVTNGSVQTTTYTTTSLKIGNENILSMLQAEFGTTFPVGAQLAFNVGDSSGFNVIDANGNEILDASHNPLDINYVFALSNSVAGGSSPSVIAPGKAVNNTATTNQTVVATIVEPDAGIYYRDSHTNNFHIDGLLTEKVNGVVAENVTTLKSVTLSIAGAGGGTVFNPADGQHDDVVFTKIKVSGSGKNLSE